MTQRQMFERGREIYIRIHGHDIESEKLSNKVHYIGSLFDFDS